jgi:uncharacterized protein (TIGR02271 family)
MTTKSRLVIGVFRDHAQAEQAINGLLQAGFDNRQIRFAGRGISPGGMLEKIKTLFINRDISEGGIYDDLVKMGAPIEEARYYQGEFEAGRAIVVVLANGDAQNAVNILVRHGGYGHDQRTVSSADVQRPLREEEQHVKLREEELSARKQTVETGEVRVHKDVVAEQKSIDVPVMREEIYVERRPGSGLPSDQPIGAGEAYRIPVHEEQVTTEKQPVESEEVIFGKQAIHGVERVTDTVQKEDVYVERTGDVNIRERDLDRERDITRDKGIDRNRDTRMGRGPGRARNIGDISDQPLP